MERKNHSVALVRGMCLAALMVLALSGCSGKYLLVADKEGVTEQDYERISEHCSTMTNAGGYVNRFRFVPERIAPKSAPRTYNTSSYGACMEAEGFVCMNCRRGYNRSQVVEVVVSGDTTQTKVYPVKDQDDASKKLD